MSDARVEGGMVGGSVLVGVRMRVMGSGRRVQSWRYFPNKALSWSEIVDVAVSSEDVDVSFVVEAFLETVGKDIRLSKGCAASISAIRCFRRLAAI